MVQPRTPPRCLQLGTARHGVPGGAGERQVRHPDPDTGLRDTLLGARRRRRLHLQLLLQHARRHQCRRRQGAPAALGPDLPRPLVHLPARGGRSLRRRQVVPRDRGGRADVGLDRDGRCRISPAPRRSRAIRRSSTAACPRATAASSWTARTSRRGRRRATHRPSSSAPWTEAFATYHQIFRDQYLALALFPSLPIGDDSTVSTSARAPRSRIRRLQGRTNYQPSFTSRRTASRATAAAATPATTSSRRTATPPSRVSRPRCRRRMLRSRRR